MTLYPIHELFHTFQGEGVHMGEPAFFIRTYGCPHRCGFCDSAGTWHKDHIPKDIVKMSSLEIIDKVIESGAPRAVITGGEPTIHDLTEITDGLNHRGIAVHLETAGAFNLKGRFFWITLSPKRDKPPLPKNIAVADEFKFIIEKPDDIYFFYNMIHAMGYHPNSGVPVWLHPEWSHREDPAVLNAISEAVKNQVDNNYRAGYQLHKLYRVDGLDKRSRPLVPLGGDPKKGY